MRSGSRTVRVNPPGTHGETGGIDGNTLVLQVIRKGRSDLALFDLVHRRLTYLPESINDGAWLWRPDLDQNRLLYGAIVRGKTVTTRYEIRVADIDGRHRRTLDVLDSHGSYAAPGQLRGRWATWVRCPDNACRVSRENLRTRAIDSPPDHQYLRHWQLAPAVDANGVVYFERALNTCGQAQIRRWDGHADTLLASLPARFAFQYAYLGKDGRNLYFDLAGCGRKARSDVYRLDVPAALRAAAER